jgi:hypothetical protein
MFEDLKAVCLALYAKHRVKFLVASHAISAFGGGFATFKLLG